MAKGESVGCGEKRTQNEPRRLSRYKGLMERNEPQREREGASRKVEGSPGAWGFTEDFGEVISVAEGQHRDPSQRLSWTE